MSSDQQWQDAYDKAEDEYVEGTITKQQFIETLQNLGLGRGDIEMAVSMAEEVILEAKTRS